jgi:hypothetical protein
MESLTPLDHLQWSTDQLEARMAAVTELFDEIRRYARQTVDLALRESEPGAR